MKKLKMKNVLIGMVVVTALAAVLQLSACKQRIDKKDKGANLEKFAIRFSVEGDGGSLKAEVEGTEINSGAEVEKGKTVIFTAKADEKKGFRIKGWTGLKAYPENTGTAKLIVSANAEIKVYFLNIVPEGFVAVPVPENYIEGKEAAYTLAGTEDFWKGVFRSGRKIKLTAYAIACHEVTYKLWKEVYDWAVRPENGYVFRNPGKKGAASLYEENMRKDLEPVTTISWRDCIVWCNAYTAMKNGNENECVYYKKDKTSLLKNSTEKENVNFVCDTAFADMSKKGFRLPTEAEWEFAARYQGDGSKEDHRINSENYGTEDKPVWFTKLDSASGAKKNWYNKEESNRVAWTNENSDWETHSVGTLSCNALGIFDMGGNVWEWCFDSYIEDPKSNDGAYMKNEIVLDPQGGISSDKRTYRAGSWQDAIEYSTVGFRYFRPSARRNDRLGFRLACSIR